MGFEVEEDPTSQFVDYTNATAFEQFIADVEQTLINWELMDRGHYTEHHPTNQQQQQQQQHGDHGKRRRGLKKSNHLTQYLSIDGGKKDQKYALTLCLPRTSTASIPTASSDSSKTTTTPRNKTWKQGLEHFTPSMLSIADSSRDFQWYLLHNSIGGGEKEKEVDVEKNTLQSIHKWFGVEEFLLLSRTRKETSSNDKVVRHSLRKKDSEDFTEDPSLVVDSTEEAKDTTMTTSSNPTETKEVDTEEDLLDEDDYLSVEPNVASLLLSALMIALGNCNCTIPAFVVVHDPNRGAFLGSAVPGMTGNVSICFETDVVPELSTNQSCISGLLDFFKLKLQLPPHIEEKIRVTDTDNLSSDLVTGMWVSASFGYQRTIEDDTITSSGPVVGRPIWRRSLVPTDSNQTVELDLILDRLYGNHQPLQDSLDRSGQLTASNNGSLWANNENSASKNLIESMNLTVMWPNLREGTYVDNVVHSTLDPLSAPEWLLDVMIRSPQIEPTLERCKPVHPLSKLLANLVQSYAKSRELSKDILVAELAPSLHPYSPSAALSSSSVSLSASSTRFSETSSSIPAARAAAVLGSAIGSLTSSLVSAATWKGSDVDEIQRIITQLFMPPEEQEEVPSTCFYPSPVRHTVPVGQLVSIVACQMGKLQGVNAMCLLWVEFVKALREQFGRQSLLPYMGIGERGENLPPVPLSTMALDLDSLSVPCPDFHQSLLHQKLQLLNCCILKFAKECSDTTNSSDHKESSNASPLSIDTWSDNGADSDDEFYDTIEHSTLPSASTAPTSASVSQSPVGIRGPAPGHLKCLLTKEPLMEPITQVAVPMTEDVAKEQQEILSRLGVSAESTILRQQIQSTALLSDMQAFKAANPSACLADFIRWYSPKDWISIDKMENATAGLPLDRKNVWWFDKEGFLSERMRGANLWQQMWEACIGVPVSKQRCLFDAIGESEKLFHYLETMSPHEMFHQMLVGAIASIHFSLQNVSQDIQKLDIVQTQIQRVLTQSHRTVALLDDALIESQMALVVKNNHNVSEMEKAHRKLQVAFEMALDACWKLVEETNTMETIVSSAATLLFDYFPPLSTTSQSTPHHTFVNLLLQRKYGTSLGMSTPSTTGSRNVSDLLKEKTIRDHVQRLFFENPLSKDPIRREYVLRCICPRPFLRNSNTTIDMTTAETSSMDPGASGDDFVYEESPLVVNRMYAAFKKHTVRFALTLGESEF